MRVDGKGLSLTFGTVEVACVSSSVVLDNEDAPAELTTFADVIAGNDRRWFFTVTAWPDLAPGTWWTLLWETPAFTPISYVYKPYANAVATAAEPHFSGLVTVDRKPALGGAAGAIWSFDARLTCTAAPTRVTAAA